MTGLARHLALAATVYADLVDAALPGRGDPNDRPAPDPTRKPAPGNLGVMDHRHNLRTLLRWWVDAVRDPYDEQTRLGDDVPGMARYLAAHEPDMAPEDAKLLYGRVRGWLATSAAIMGGSISAPIDLTTDQLDQRVRVADAARLLGCTVRTIQRRVPADQRPGGMVRLEDALPRCEHCDLPAGQCAHTVRVEVAQ